LFIELWQQQSGMPPVPRHWSSSFQVKLEDGVQNPDNAFSISTSTVVYKRRQRNGQIYKIDILKQYLQLSIKIKIFC